MYTPSIDDTISSAVHEGAQTCGEEEGHHAFVSSLVGQQAGRLSAPGESQQVDSLGLIMEQWLLDKYSLTQSKCTEMTYRDILVSLRAHLRERGLDLDSSAGEIAPVIQDWARLRASGSRRQGSVTPSTYNQRIAAVSSFYRWAIAKGLYSDSNPADRLARASVQKYARARALNPQQVSSKLRSIDRSTPRGLRDYMLLQVALNTGRTAQELASLTWRNVSIDGDSVILTFERCKGGKTMYACLDARLSKALLAYLRVIYGESLDTLAPHTPLWMSFSDRSLGQAIGPQTIADICESHLGVSTVHTLRHTFALAMNQSGAETSIIQRQLGHESMATTAGYLATLKKGHNPYASALARVFSVEEVCL
jgi:site-specific recombinase XerD